MPQADSTSLFWQGVASTRHQIIDCSIALAVSLLGFVRELVFSLNAMFCQIANDGLPNQRLISFTVHTNYRWSAITPIVATSPSLERVPKLGFPSFVAKDEPVSFPLRERPVEFVVFASRWLNRIFSGLAVVLIALCIIMNRWRGEPVSDAERMLQEAAELLAAERFDDAGPLAWEVMRGQTFREEGTLIAARTGARLKRSQPTYRRQSSDQTPAANATLEQLYDHADRLLDAGRIREAEQWLREVLARDARHHDANHNLAMLLRLENRFREAQPYLLELYRQGCFRREYLLTTGRGENRGLLTGGDDLYVDLCLASVPSDPLPTLNRVSIEQFVADPKASLQMLDAVVSQYPEMVEAQARRGWLLQTSGMDEKFLAWNRSLNHSTEEHPLVWTARGLYLHGHGDPRGAVHCLLQAVELDPINRQAFYQLTQLFRELGEGSRANACAQRASLLERFESVLGAPPTTLEQLLDAVEIATALQRPWEALGWAHEAARLFPNDPSLRELVARRQSEVSPQMPLCVVEPYADWRISAGEYPHPDWNSLMSKKREREMPAARSHSVRFADRAKSMGIDFLFKNGAAPGTAYMFELSGGGVGVVDFDGDGWSDLYLTQGCNWPVDDHDTQNVDRLFRNVLGERFEEVTNVAGLVENGLSQSASVGDFNADGFPDVYVGNVGANRLWINNGDGTYRDATEAAGIAGNDWTASAAFGDFNGDGIQDLYVVNYLSGPDVFTRKCFHPVGNDRVPVQCSPTLFPAAQDRLYLNLGDGGFADVTIESGIVAPNGKGLAVVLADFERTRRLNVFVANDTTANFYFVNRVEKRGEPLRFVEQGVQTGLAYDGAGNAQSSMGVAAGDADQDGSLDLFVTNFSHELNTLYLHQPEDVFVDGIRESGLAEPGFAMMGWGAQFLDGDLDGLDDLFVANGDLYPTSNPYQMPQQYFHNRGNGRFILGTPENLGPYFRKIWLGRAVARLDVNRDGLPDLAVTHVDSPFALLVNETPRHGKFLRVKLRGVISDRDAIGATVRVTGQGKTWSQQLVGGDGFAVSNERILTFGLGTTEWIDSISIAWPSGADDEYQERIPTDSELLFVEGSHRIVLLNRNP